MGTNLGACNDYGGSWPFENLMLHCRKQISGLSVSPFTWDDGRAIAHDADGWPTSLDTNQIVRFYIADPNSGHPTGSYLMLYDGEGTLNYYLGASRTAGAGTGRESVTISGTSGIRVELVSTNPANPLRNMRLVPVAAEFTHTSAPFRSGFTASLAHVSVLRFMDWGSTNNSNQVNWSDRIPHSNWAYGSSAFASGMEAVPYERMVQLSNATLKHPWICVPLKATDTYVTSLATLLRDSVDSRLKVHVEVSNEVWNTGFTQNAYAQAEGEADGDLGTGYTASMKWYGRRCKEIHAIFVSVFGGTDRLVRVVAGQAANPSGTGAVSLDQDNCKATTDLYAHAAYFARNVQPPNDTTVDDETVDQMLDYLEFTAIPTAVGYVTSSKSMLSTRGAIPLAEYECGQHAVGILGAENNTTLTALFLAANGHPRMYGIYLRYLDGLRAAYGSDYLACHYTGITNWSKWGSWGAMRFWSDTIEAAHKHRALVHWASDTTLYAHIGQTKDGTASTLEMTPTALGDGRLIDFDFETSIPGSLTTTRTGTATYRDASGNGQLATANVARQHRDPVTGRKGLLVEPSRTNICLRSKLDGGATPTGWTVTGTATDTASAYGGADGARARSFSVTAEAAYLQQVVALTANTSYAFSVEIESVTGTITNQDVLTAVSLPSGCTITAWRVNGTTSAAGTQAAVGLLTAILSGTYSDGNGTFRIGAGCTGSVTATVVLSRPQLESCTWQLYASTWIPTDGASVARGPEGVRLTGTPATDVIDNAHGTIYVEFSLLQGGSDQYQYGRRVVALRDTGTTEEHSIFNPAGVMRGESADGGVAQSACDSTGTVLASSPTKFAYAFAANDMRACKAGTLTSADTSGTMPTCTQFQFGSHTDTTEAMNGLLHRFAYWATRESDSTLQTLTS